jgi:hypothetical protein
MRKVDALLFKGVETRRFNIRITGIARGLLPPLVRKNENHIRTVRHRLSFQSHWFGFIDNFSQHQAASNESSQVLELRLADFRVDSGLGGS